MKRILMITLLMSGLTAMSQMPEQSKPNRMDHRDLNPEQLATLRTKKLALSLDLNEKQRSEVMALELQNANEQVKQRDNRKKRGDDSTKPTADERYNLLNARLDRQLAHKEGMKKILTADQYQKWERMQDHRAGKRHHHGRHHSEKSRR